MSAGDEEQEEYTDVGNINISCNAVKDRAAIFGSSKPTVMNKPKNSVLNRFPQFTATDGNETSKIIGGINYNSPNKLPPPKTAPKTYGNANKFPVSPPNVAQKSSDTNKFPVTPPSVAQKSSDTNKFPVTPPNVAQKSSDTNKFPPLPSGVAKISPQSLEKVTPPPVLKKSPSPFSNNKMWNSSSAEDHNHNVKSVADPNSLPSNTSSFAGGKKVTSSSSFQTKSNSSVDLDNRKSCSDGTIKDIQSPKQYAVSEGNEMLINFKSQLKSAKTINRTADPVKVFPDSRQRLPDNITPGFGQKDVDNNTKSASPIAVRKKSVNKRYSSLTSIKTRQSDNKRFKQISKGTLISSHDAPMKHRRPVDADITMIVEEYKTAVKELVDSVQEDEDIYDDVDSFARGSCLVGDRVSFIADMTEEEEFGSDQTSGSGSMSASGSGGGFKQIEEEIYEEEPVEEGEMDDVYEEVPGDASSVSELSEKERKEREKQEKAEKLRQEKEEKKKKEAARKEQEKKEKAEKAEKVRLEKERLAKEKKEEREKKKKLKSETTDDTSRKGSIDDGGSHVEQEYDDFSIPVVEEGVMEEEYEALDDIGSSSSSLPTVDKEDKSKPNKDDKEEKKRKEAARKEQERKEKEKQKEEKERLAKEKKEKERKEKEDKELKKKFKIDPSAEKVGTGIILENVKGGKHDLAVTKGDHVEIMRMDNNPKGKFLIKTEDYRWGYVESSNIEIPTDIIKEVMTCSDTYVNIEPPITEEGSHTKCEDASSFQEEIYEECS